MLGIALFGVIWLLLGVGIFLYGLSLPPDEGSGGQEKCDPAESRENERRQRKEPHPLS